MTYALTLEEGPWNAYHVWCARCHRYLETMTAEIIARALASKGTLICPECRRKKELCLSSSPNLHKLGLPPSGGLGGQDER